MNMHLTTFPLLLVLAACGGSATEPSPHAPATDGGTSPEAHDASAVEPDAGSKVEDAGAADSGDGGSCLGNPAGREYNGTCRWQDGRCFNYYGWPEADTVESRTCAFAPWSSWSLTPCTETCECRARENADGSRTVVCGFPE